jgi:hypothetical protein
MDKLNLDFSNKPTWFVNPTLRIFDVHPEGNVTIIGELSMQADGTHKAIFHDNNLSFTRDDLLKVANKIAELDDDWIARQNDKASLKKI